jgi:hypothetical protein
LEVFEGRIIKRMADQVFAVTRPSSPLLPIAGDFERFALQEIARPRQTYAVPAQRDFVPIQRH